MAIDRADPDQPVDLGDLLSELALKIERVKQLYEQYFMGIEKMEPTVARKDVARSMLTLQQQYIRNTGLRFKFNTMLQKWNIYVTYWNRTLREIENGTYIRHLVKARRAAEREGKELPAELLPRTRRNEAKPLSQDVDSGVFAVQSGSRKQNGDFQTEPGLERVHPKPPAPLFPPPPAATAKPPAHPPTATARPPVSPPPLPLSQASAKARALPAIPGMSEQDLHNLHQKFSAARKQCGETNKVSYEALVNSLAKQVPKVLETPGARGVRFDVALQDGKAVVKAIPTK